MRTIKQQPWTRSIINFEVHAAHCLAAKLALLYFLCSISPVGYYGRFWFRWNGVDDDLYVRFCKKILRRRSRWKQILIFNPNNMSGYTPFCQFLSCFVRFAVGMGPGWSVKLVTLPAQSPDQNIIDLGSVASLQSRVWWMNASSVDELGKTIF